MSDSLRANLKHFGQYIKGCGSDSLGINGIVYNNQTIIDDTDGAKCLNNYFKSIFPPLQDFTFSSHGSSVSPMNPIELSASGIEKLLKQMDETKATGPDGISPRTLRRCAEPISLYLHIVYKQSLLRGLLTGKLIIDKGGTRNDIENYGPIFLTSTVCKVMEPILHFGIMKHLIENKILTNDQHGFRKGFSCNIQLAEFYHDLLSHIDSGGQPVCILFDFRKIFDAVTH